MTSNLTVACLDKAMHGNTRLLWQWKAAQFHQPRTIEMLKREIQTLTEILKEMEAGQ